ncbi:hypothetical protein Cni_G00035 [Canna indica]|uniref:Uncharacterized protein n=1 Tax=Canna indica TaxID=4628 RepID=A0AAQ3PYU5_9LILI|nr:hypothetical protein Cni_G00035 [Canna indica]
MYLKVYCSKQDSINNLHYIFVTVSTCIQLSYRLWKMKEATRAYDCGSILAFFWKRWRGRSPCIPAIIQFLQCSLHIISSFLVNYTVKQFVGVSLKCYFGIYRCKTICEKSYFFALT